MNSRVQTFRKKPIALKVMQWTGEQEHLQAAKNFVGDSLLVDLEVNLATKTLVPKLAIQTLEGRMEVSVGDWIIRGVKGEFYPCKPDIFAETYEVVIEPPEPVNCDAFYGAGPRVKP